MTDVIREVAKTIFLLLLATILFKFIIIDSKSHMWEAIDSVTRSNWSMYTLKDGKEIDEELEKVLKNTADLTTK
ncbi:hypothetical protein QEW_4701 [Clostridioides difficile CD160]|nr:hypothetical protein QEW_4701 [Clostridioides difficile CD160]